MTKPVGQEQFERVGLAALTRHKDMQLLLLQGFATESNNKWVKTAPSINYAKLTKWLSLLGNNMNTIGIPTKR